MHQAKSDFVRIGSAEVLSPVTNVAGRPRDAEATRRAAAPRPTTAEPASDGLSTRASVVIRGQDAKSAGRQSLARPEPKPREPEPKQERPQAKRPAGRHGVLDPITSANVTGWCFREEGDQNASYVVLMIDDILHAPIQSDQFYEGSEHPSELPLGGYVGFTFTIPARFHDGNTHTLRAFVTGTGMELAGSPARFTLPALDPAARLRSIREFSLETLIYESTLEGRAAFVKKLQEKRKLAICCSFFETSRFGPHHVSVFEFLRSNGFVIVNVHALGAAMLDQPHCGGRIDWSVVKVNKGYDFGSWQVGLARVIDVIDLADKVVFANDSLIGPLAGSASHFADFIEQQDGLFGITDSYDHNYHLQSYFFGFGRDKAARQFVIDFLIDFKPSSDKRETIANGELGLGREMGERGFQPAVYCPYSEVVDAWLADVRFIRRNVADVLPLAETASRAELDSSYQCTVSQVLRGAALNPTHYFWYTLATRFRHPFVKRELLFKNPTQIPDHVLIMDFLRQNCPDSYMQALALARAGRGSSFPPLITGASSGASYQQVSNGGAAH